VVVVTNKTKGGSNKQRRECACLYFSR